MPRTLHELKHPTAQRQQRAGSNVSNVLGVRLHCDIVKLTYYHGPLRGLKLFDDILLERGKSKDGKVETLIMIADAEPSFFDSNKKCKQ